MSKLQKIENKNAYRTANKEYFYCNLTFESGAKIDLLFTEKDLLKAADRAKKNQEDIPKLTFWNRIKKLF